MRTKQLSCARTRGLLEAYFEGVLSPRRAHEVAAHLGACPACARELLQLERIAAALAAVPPGRPTGDLVGRISAQIAALPAPANRRALIGGWRRVAGWVAACVVVLAAWRYLVPTVFAEQVASLLRLGWVKAAAVGMVELVARAPDTVREMLVRGQLGAEALGLTASLLAPTIGLYAAAEVGVIVAIVLIGRRARRTADTMLFSAL